MGWEAALGSPRPGSQPPLLLPRPPAEPRGTPSVTWRPPGSPWRLARGSPGPPEVRAREGCPGLGGVCTLEPFSSLLVPFPIPELSPWSPANRSRGTCFPTSFPGVPGVHNRLVAPAHCAESTAGRPSRKSGWRAFTFRPGAAHWPEAARAAFRPR